MRGILALMLLAGSAQADDVIKAREHYKAGSRAYEIGSYEEAIREYGEAYRLKDDPAILYNMAQANRLAEHPTEAEHLYRMYLMKVPNAPNRAEVLNKIDALQRLLEDQRRTKNLPPDTTLPRPHEPAPTTTAPATTVPPSVTVDSNTLTAAPEPPKKRRAWVVPVAVVAALAVVGVAVGVGVGLGAAPKTVDPLPSLTPVRWR